MTRVLVPLTLLVAAIGLFVMFTNPGYQRIKELKVKVVNYEKAVAKVEELIARKQQLTNEYSAISADNLAKVERILPDNVDNIRLIIDINAVAQRNALSLSAFSIGETSPGRSLPSVAAVGESTDPVGSVTLGFKLSGSYDQLLKFIKDLEKSERLVDVQNLDFQVNAVSGSRTDYDFSIRTYWLH